MQLFCTFYRLGLWFHWKLSLLDFELIWKFVHYQYNNAINLPGQTLQTKEVIYLPKPKTWVWVTAYFSVQTEISLVHSSWIFYKHKLNKNRWYKKNNRAETVVCFWQWIYFKKIKYGFELEFNWFLKYIQE